MTSNLEKCFEKHSFNELSYIDYNEFIKALNFTKNKFCSKIFFDVGSNCGSFIRASNFLNLNYKIHCFEPHPFLAKKTKEYYPDIIMNNFCLGSKVGNIDIFIPTWSVGLSSLINRPVFKNLNQEINIVNVGITTLDSYCTENNVLKIDYLKIDVEGSEFDVIKGAENMFKNNNIIAGQFEIGCTEDAGVSSEQICQYLENFGYTIYKNILQNDFIFSL